MDATPTPAGPASASLRSPTTGRRRRAALQGSLLAALVVVGAAWLRLVALAEIPPGLHFDEAVYGLMAEEIRHGARPIFFRAYTGREPLYMYAVALVSAATGTTAYTIRLTSALAGALSVALAYGLGRALFGTRAGVGAAAFLAVSYWHIAVSRNGYPNVLIPPIEAAAAIALWRGWTNGDRRAWIAGGVLSGLVLYTYLAARLWPVFLLLLLVVAGLGNPRRLAQRRGGIGLAALAGLLVVAPLGVHFGLHPADFWERADQVLAHRQQGGGALLATYGRHAARSLQALAWPGLGDPRWHFNLPGRPMWTWPTAVFLAVGTFICIRRARELRFAVPLLWVALMALPGLLTLEMQPAGQRMFGVFPALALLPALGVAWTAARLPHRAAWPLLLALAVGNEARASVGAYFGAWATAPEVASTYHADHIAIAKLGRDALAAGHPLVILSEHFRHPTVAFTAPGVVEAAVWADPRRALPVAPPEAGAPPTVYLVSAALLDAAPLASEWLEDRASDRREHALETTAAPEGFGRGTRSRDSGRKPGPARIVRFDVAAPTVAGARASGGARALAARRSRPQLGGELAVLGAPEVRQSGRDGAATAAGPPLRRDRPITVTVRLAALEQPPPDEARSLSLRLVDAEARVRAQADQIGLVPVDWRGPGREFLSFFTLVVDPATPPGRYGLSLRYAGAGGEGLPVLVDGVAAEELSLAPRIELGASGRARVSPESAAPLAFLSSAASQAPGRADRSPWDRSGLAVLGAQIRGAAVASGESVDVEIAWARTGAEAPPEPAATLDLHLEGPAGPWPVLAVPIAAGYPPARWSRFEALTEIYRLPVPDEVPDGRYAVVARVPGLHGHVVIGSLDVEAFERIFARPEPAVPVGAVFAVAADDPSDPPVEIELIGFDLQRPDAGPDASDRHAGGPGEPRSATSDASVIVQWRADGTPARDLKVFVHLVDEGDVIVSQHDARPAGEGRPTRSWRAGEIVLDAHPLSAPRTMAGLELAIGLYDPETGERMPVVDAAGAAVTDRAVRVPLSAGGGSDD